MVQIRFVRVWKGKKQMDVVFDDGDQKRKVKFSWQNREKSDVPPDHWFDIVKGETRFMDAERKRGGIPGIV